MNKKIHVAVLGATGAVGQKFVYLLQDHPTFDVAELVASPRNRGKRYAEAATWHETGEIPDTIANMKLKGIDESLDSQVLLSGLDSSVAGEAEEAYAKAGHMVISNAKNHRMDANVPLVIPEINAAHIHLVKEQPWSGGIITNPNCSTMFLALALAPLHRAFGIKSVQVTTLQAISGAGYPGVPSMDILGNIVPYISGEEDKVETEANKILGAVENGTTVPAEFPVSAQCTRVPVADGHTESVSVELSEKVDVSRLREVMTAFTGPPQELGLPSAPENPLQIIDEPNRPQPLRDVSREGGMVTWIGRIRPCPVADYKMIVLGHNTIRGAAGAAILNAEMAQALGYIKHPGA